MTRLVRTFLGIGCLLLGVVGCFLPLLQGWLFLSLGLWFLAPSLALRLRRRLLGKRFKDPLVDLPEWTPLGARAGFTTRHFPHHLPSTDELSNEQRHRSIKEEISLRLKIASPLRTVSMRQVHGDRVALIESEEDFSGREFLHLEGTDALVTRLPGTALLAMTADCLSVYYYLPGKGGQPGWIGLAHAGWRGTRAGIAAKTARLILDRSGRGASDLEVLFGPRIGRDRYEVGEEFAGHFHGDSLRRLRGRLHFDLAGENRRQLAALGVRRDRILDTGVCTVSENQHFFSYRLERERAGRLVSYLFKA